MKKRSEDRMEPEVLKTLGNHHARTNWSRDRAVIQQRPAHADPTISTEKPGLGRDRAAIQQWPDHTDTAVGVERPGFEKYNMSHELIFALKVT